jgi:3-dehydroquinate synthase
VTNTTVAPLYLAKVKALLTLFTVAEVILPDGEQYKTLDTVNEIFTALLTAHHHLLTFDVLGEQISLCE